MALLVYNLTIRTLYNSTVRPPRSIRKRFWSVHFARLYALRNRAFMNFKYWAGGLQTGQHTVKLTNTEDTRYVDLDYVIATSSSGPIASPTPIHA